MKSRVWPILVLVLFCAAITCFVFGCDTKIKGGEMRHDTGSLDVTGGEQRIDQNIAMVRVGSDRSVEIRFANNAVATTQPSSQSEHDNIATTQPSISTNTGQMPKMSGASEGEIGGFKFEQAVNAFKNAWWLGLLFILVGAVFLYRTKIVFGLIMISAGAVTIMWPMAASVGFILLFIGFGVYWYLSEREKNEVKKENSSLQADAKDIVKSVEMAVETLDDSDKLRMESLIGRKMDKKTKIRVGQLKNS